MVQKELSVKSILNLFYIFLACLISFILALAKMKINVLELSFTDVFEILYLPIGSLLVNYFRFPTLGYIVEVSSILLLVSIFIFLCWGIFRLRYKYANPLCLLGIWGIGFLWTILGVSIGLSSL
jgi:hypothetical protein